MRQKGKDSKNGMEKRKKGMNCIKKAFSKMLHVCADFLARCPKLAKVFIALFAIVLGLTGGTYVYAKYYSLSAKEGIAIATGVYFSANYAVDADGEFVESFVSIGYKGGDTSFSLEVRNYENNLLFNTDNVNIPYTIEIWLESAPVDGAVYSVSVEDGVHVLADGEENKITISGQFIAGGAARANSYNISVDAPGDSGHTPIPIYVRIQTLDGSLINRTLTGKMLLSSTGRVESYIESQGFVIPDEPTELSKFERLNSLSAFTYEVLTVGSVASSGVTEELRVSWDPTVLQIDLFDEAYVEWLETEKTENPDKEITGPYVDTDSGLYYITIDIMPYSAENIGFFRGADFDTKATDLKTLENYIEADKIVTTS